MGTYEKKNYFEPRINFDELKEFEYLLDHPETPIVAENGAFKKIKEQFYRLLSIPERAANNMVDEELRARAAKQQGTQDGHEYNEPEPQET